MKTPVTRLLLKLPAAERPLAEAVKVDLAAAAYVQQVVIEEGAEREIVVELGTLDTPGEPRP